MVKCVGKAMCPHGTVSPWHCAPMALCPHGSVSLRHCTVCAHCPVIIRYLGLSGEARQVVNCRGCSYQSLNLTSGTT